MNQRVAFENRSPSLRLWHRKAAANRLRGLTTHGKPRQRRVYLNASERVQGNRQISLSKYERRALKNQLAGMTTRGTPRVYRLNRFDRVVLEADFDALAGLLAECFDSLPPKAQAKAVDLAAHLTELKRRFK